jgi:hypothetical protein
MNMYATIAFLIGSVLSNFEFRILEVNSQQHFDGEPRMLLKWVAIYRRMLQQQSLQQYIVNFTVG